MDSASQKEGWKGREEPKVTSEAVILKGQQYHILGEELENQAASCFGPEKPQGLEVRVKLLTSFLKQGKEDTSWERRTPHPRGTTVLADYR